MADAGCCVSSASAVSHGADGGVAELGHGRSRCHGVLLVVPERAAMAAARCGAARERGEQSFAEARVHEAVNDGVDAGGGVAQQVDESDGGPGEGVFGRRGVESPPGVGAVQRHPAQEEQEHDDHQHADDPLLGLQLGLGGVAAGPFCLDHPAGRGGHAGHLYRVRPLDGGNVATVAIFTATRQRGGESILHICAGEQSKTVLL